MKFKSFVAGLLVALWACSASALGVTVYDSASLKQRGGGTVGLDGFGRTAETLLVAQPFSFAAVTLAGPRVPFFDIWNIDTSGVAPGVYSLTDMLVEASGTVQFGFVTFNSIDIEGVRNTIVFDINAGGTQAVGSGTFTVLAQCPIASCVWIDVIGTQEQGSGLAGYGDNGNTVAVLVPEPATYGLMALGLAGVGLAARRRRRA